MADRVYLSVWLRGFTVHNMLRHYQRALDLFPFSRLAPGAILRIYALEFQEPPLLERRFEDEADVEAVIAAAREFENEDCAYQLNCFWDLWQYDNGWSLKPAPVSITLLGPLFPADLGEQLLYDLGPDQHFLPDPGLPGSGTPIRSNVRSVLRLAHDLDEALANEKRTLWSESGENLAERLQQAIEGQTDD